MYVIICFFGVVGLFLMPNEKSNKGKINRELLGTQSHVKDNILATIRLMKDRRMALLIPMLFYCGLSQGT